MKLSVNETKWSSLLARTCALILYISIRIFEFGPENLPGLSRNGSQVPVVQKVDNAIHRINLYPLDSAIGFPNTYSLLDSDLSGPTCSKVG